MNSARSLSVLFSLAVLSLAILVMWLGRSAVHQPDNSLTIREVAVMAPPPPPPPPPKVQQTQVNQDVSLKVPGEGAAMHSIDIPEPDIKLELPNEPVVATSQPKWQPLDIDWQAFELNDLDGFPTLLTPLRVKLPASVSRRGVNKVMIKLDVVIDTDGQIELINIVENPYVELEPAIAQMVKTSRFSAPQKDGAPVRARFIWPIEIKA